MLRGVDLQIRQGEVVAVLGTNGSGKSTLIRTIVGLLPAARGEVRLFGTPVPRFRQWRRIGYVPQRITAAGGVPATVHEVVSSGLLSKRRMFTPLGSAGKEAIDAALEIVDMADRRKDAVAELSGGQQQRVLIARALVSEPERSDRSAHQRAGWPTGFRLVNPPSLGLTHQTEFTGESGTTTGPDHSGDVVSGSRPGRRRCLRGRRG